MRYHSTKLAILANVAILPNLIITAMPSPDFARPKTSYRKLHVFSKAETIYDLTYLFLQTHIPKTDRTYDQMLQAARSGKQNIVEGRSDAASSAEIEIKLFGVARGSLHELLNDYEDYMRTRRLSIWNQNHPRFANQRKTCRDHNETVFFTTLADRLTDEEFCNMMLTLINQAISMLNKMIDLIKADFLKNGGIKEQMYHARLHARNS